MYALTAEYSLDSRQLDISTAFLHKNLDEETYMIQPEGFYKGVGKKVCFLKKVIYGLKQASRQWYKTLNEILLKCSLRKFKILLFDRKYYKICN